MKDLSKPNHDRLISKFSTLAFPDCLSVVSKCNQLFNSVSKSCIFIHQYVKALKDLC